MKCKSCEGTGKVNCSDCSGEGFQYGRSKCTSCGGDGLVACSKCNGEGKIGFFRWLKSG